MSTQNFVQNLKNHLTDLSQGVDVKESGIVHSVRDNIVEIIGLDSCMSSEMILIGDSEIPALALNLERDRIGAIVLGDGTQVSEGDTAVRTKEVLSIPIGDDVLGRVVNPLMHALDDGPALKKNPMRPIERLAPGVMARQGVDEPLQTGIKAIDALVPIGRGQRELIIGDRQTGKTTVALDAILNQKDQNMKCVYVAIGQKKSKVMRIVEELKKAGAMEYTTVVLAGASDNPALLYLAPYAGVSIAEYFMDKEEDVLIVYDDLSKHAAAYREISLLLRRPPGREAYPGDVFYAHSRLLERAARRNKEAGGGSITALPIVETQAGDVSGYIPTNVISITDGQIFLETGLFNKGIRPAINVGTSVSRVGGSAQIKSMKKVAGPLKLDLAQYREMESFAQFGSDLDASTRKTLARGKRMTQLLKQNQFSPVPVALQVASLYAANKGFLDDIDPDDVSRYEALLSEYLENNHEDLLSDVAKGWGDDEKDALKKAISDFHEIVKDEFTQSTA